jgi:radical SAM protein with 4Fe4S-binding SPASM domain
MLVQIGRRERDGTVRQGAPALDHVDDAAAAAAAAPTPLFAHLYVENRCHLSCAHCYESEDTFPERAHDDADGALSLEQWCVVLDQLRALGVFVVTFSGGEVFLRRDFLDLVAEARQRRFAVRIYTSGTLLDEARADRLKALGVSEVHVSVYSDRPEDHDRFTGVPRSWERSVRAIRLLRARGITTVLKANVMTFNVDRLEHLVALTTELDCHFSIDPTVKPRLDGDRRPLDFAISAERIATAVLANPALNRFVSLEEAKGLCDGQNVRAGKDVGMCAAAHQLIAIHADGSVAPCAMFPLATGHAARDDLAGIWRASPLFARVRGQRFDDMKSCGTCGVQSTCDPCMAFALIEHGDHRACNTSSRTMAEAGRQHMELLQKADAKARVGRPLPLAGDATIPVETLHLNGKVRLDLEQG